MALRELQPHAIRRSIFQYPYTSQSSNHNHLCVLPTMSLHLGFDTHAETSFWTGATPHLTGNRSRLKSTTLRSTKKVYS